MSVLRLRESKKFRVVMSYLTGYEETLDTFDTEEEAAAFIKGYMARKRAEYLAMYNQGASK